MKTFNDQICALEILSYSDMEIWVKGNGIRGQRTSYYGYIAVYKKSDGAVAVGIEMRRWWWKPVKNKYKPQNLNIDIEREEMTEYYNSQLSGLGDRMGDAISVWVLS